jgi:hypothetical protein
MAPIENINAGKMTFQARALDPETWQQSKCSAKWLQAAVAAAGSSLNDCAIYVCTNVPCVAHRFKTRRVSLHA